MSKNFDRYLKTYSGQNLKYSMDTVGIWQVLGEDTNCDFGGSHIQPTLGYYEGKLRDVIEMAVDMPSFWAWGAGGDFKLTTVKKVDPVTTAKTHKLKAEADALEARLKEINTELKGV